MVPQWSRNSVPIRVPGARLGTVYFDWDHFRSFAFLLALATLQLGRENWGEALFFPSVAVAACVAFLVGWAERWELSVGWRWFLLGLLVFWSPFALSFRNETIGLFFALAGIDQSMRRRIGLSSFCFLAGFLFQPELSVAAALGVAVEQGRKGRGGKSSAAFFKWMPWLIVLIAVVATFPGQVPKPALGAALVVLGLWTLSLFLQQSSPWIGLCSRLGVLGYLGIVFPRVGAQFFPSFLLLSVPVSIALVGLFWGAKQEEKFSVPLSLPFIFLLFSLTLMDEATLTLLSWVCLPLLVWGLNQLSRKVPHLRRSWLVFPLLLVGMTAGVEHFRLIVSKRHGDFLRRDGSAPVEKSPLPFHYSVVSKVP